MSTALVTGGSRGLGRALVRELVRRGHRVLVLDPLPCPAEDGFVHHRCDLTDLDPELVDGFPPLDVLVCNAGVTAIGDFATMPPELDRSVLETNVIGHMNLVKHILRRDKLASGARVAFTVSASVYVPWPVGIAYAASKAALDGFALALESYLSDRGASVTRIYPGAMRTDHGGYARRTGRRVGVDPERIAPRIVCGIFRRRRRIFPDAMGRALVGACRLFPRTTSRWIRRRLAPEALAAAPDAPPPAPSERRAP